jgi:hypothetical protein
MQVKLKLLIKQSQYLCLILASLFMPVVVMAETYLTPEQFVQAAFNTPTLKTAPTLETLWLTKEVATQAEAILGHSLKQVRIKFWKAGLQTAWILDEIGKEEPITAGFVVNNGKIIQTTVLAYRESRGSEVRHAGFLKQYLGASLQADTQLNKTIDGISGATLSVRAMGRMARLALYFDQVSRQQSN